MTVEFKVGKPKREEENDEKTGRNREIQQKPTP